MSRTTWMDATLGEIADIVGGATPKTSVEDYWDGHVYWATPKDLSELDGAEISATPRTLTPAGLRSCSAQVLPPGSVLLSSRAPIGHVAINTVPMATNQGFKSLVPRQDRVDAKFLYWWLRRNRPALEAMGTGATFKEISKKTTAAIPIQLPPIDEQRRIAAVLDAADELRTKRREALAKLDTLTQAIFIDMFGDPAENARGWPRATLGEILERVDSGKSPTCLDRPAQAGEWGVLKAGAVSYGFFRPDENKALPDGVAPDSRHEVRAGDILFSRKNTHDLVATTAYVDSTPPRLLMSDLIFRLVIDPPSGVDARFLQAQLSTPRTKRDLQALAGGSSGSMPNISKAKVRQAHVVVPPTEMQRVFAARVQSVEAAIGRGKRSAATLNALFSSLQQRAFRGEL